MAGGGSQPIDGLKKIEHKQESCTSFVFYKTVLLFVYSLLRIIVLYQFSVYDFVQFLLLQSTTTHNTKWNTKSQCVAQRAAVTALAAPINQHNSASSWHRIGSQCHKATAHLEPICADFWRKDARDVRT
jgi:hypothetical protein